MDNDSKPREFWVTTSVRPNQVAEVYPFDYGDVLRSMLAAGYIKKLILVREVLPSSAQQELDKHD